jgi:hypothetical protein
MPDKYCIVFVMRYSLILPRLGRPFHIVQGHLLSALAEEIHLFGKRKGEAVRQGRRLLAYYLQHIVVFWVKEDSGAEEMQVRYCGMRGCKWDVAGALTQCVKCNKGPHQPQQATYKPHTSHSTRPHP